MSRVLVLGNAATNLLLPVPRLPRPGETLMARSFSRAPGGKGLNQAVVAARAGAAVAFRAPVGDDADARLIGDVLAKEGFAGLELIGKPHPTDISVILTDADGENSIVSASPCADAFGPVEAAEFAAGAAAADLLLLQGNLSEAATLAAARAAGQSGARVLLNLAPLRWAPAAILAHCAIVVTNQGEAAEASGCADPWDAAAQLHALGPTLVIVTLGAAGCVCVGADGRHAWPSMPTRVVDTAGAGDTFCGVLAAALACHLDVPDAIAAAQRAAALTVARPGVFASLPQREELLSLLAGAHRHQQDGSDGP